MGSHYPLVCVPGPRRANWTGGAPRCRRSANCSIIPSTQGHIRTADVHEERATIETLAKDIPALWHAPATTNADRKQILRCLIDRVVVQVRCDSEHVAATIHWKGGYESHHEFIRPVKTYAQLRDFEPLMTRIVELRDSGRNAEDIAKTLNREGFRPPKKPGSFNKPMI